MSNINLNNYEAYLLDYFEGNLSNAAVAELRNFVLLHPELNLELDTNDLPYFDKDEENIDFKNDLLKTETQFDFSQSGISKNDFEIINYLEGNVSLGEKKNFEKRLSEDDQLKRDLEGYKKSFLISDAKNILEDKNKLYKTKEELVLNNAAIMYVEDLLIGNEKLAFEIEMKSNSVLAAEVKAFEKAKVDADYSVLHPNKDSLKKEAKVIVFFTTRNVIAIAAAILLIIGLTVLFNNADSNPEFKQQKAEAKKLKNNINPEKQMANTIVPIKNIEEIKKPQRNLAAKTNKVQSNIVVLKNDSVFQKKEEPGLIADNEIKSNVPDLIIKQDTTLAIIAIKTNAVENKQNELTHNAKQTVLLAVEESDNEDVISTEETKSKNGFWKRAVKLAKQVNGFGIKAVSGDEKANDNYLISFNGFSVEKK